VGQPIDELVSKLRDLHRVMCEEILAGYDWRAKPGTGAPAAFRGAVYGTVNYLRDPALPANKVDDGPPLHERFRRVAAKLDRPLAACSGGGQFNPPRVVIVFFQALRVWMTKQDVGARQAR